MTLVRITLVLWIVAACATAALASVDSSRTSPVVADSDDETSMAWASYQRVTIDGAPPNPHTVIRPVPFAIASTVYLGAMVGLHIYQANAWWKKDRGPFHFQEDWSENLQNDKFGHFFGAYVNSYFIRETLIECGFGQEASHDFGGILGGLYSLFVEIEDGFSTRWGFSPTDAYADLLGAGYFLIQADFPILQNFHEKWNYWPSKFLGSGSIPGQQRTFIDDYQGQSYWWSADVWNMLPANAQSWYPKWLQLSIGYTARKHGIYDPTGAHLAQDPRSTTDVADTREIYFGLDYSLQNLIPKTNIAFIDWLVQTLDNFHFPAPAIRLTPTVKAFLLYPIQLKIGNFNF